jgi:hypothetical protein
MEMVYVFYSQMPTGTDGKQAMQRVLEYSVRCLSAWYRQRDWEAVSSVYRSMYQEDALPNNAHIKVVYSYSDMWDYL